MPSRRSFALILFLGVALLSRTFVQGQSTYGFVAGSVTDPSGAAIVDAKIKLINLETSQERFQVTGDEGLYFLSTVIPGQYRLEVEKRGFKRVTREPIIVQVQQSTHIDVVMQVGMASEVIDVTGETPLLQSETSSLGQVVDRRKANELPLNGRNIFNLVALSPGVVPQGQSNDTPVGKNIFAWANYQIGGSFANQSAQYLDGQPLNTGYINVPVIVPTQDSIQEFKVQTNALGPEWGKFSGGVINLHTKSGTNQIHGEAHEYLRNKLLNANEYFRKASQISGGEKNEPPPFTQNQFGVSAGGPVIKDKTFWFFSWESFRQRGTSGQVFTTNVPTAAESNGDFTGLTDHAGNPITIYDPASTDPHTGLRKEFPTHNVIPLSEQDPTARALLNLFPHPTGPGIYNNYIVAASEGGDQNQFVFRIDQNLTQKQRLFFRFSYWNLLNVPKDPLGTGLCVDRCTEAVHTKAGAFDYNVSFSPTTIGDFNFSVSRFGYDRTPKNAGFDLTTIGWPASFNTAVPAIMRTPPTPCIEDMTAGCAQGQSFIVDHNTQWNFSPSISMIRGHHRLVFGGQIEVGRDNYAQTNIASGFFAFDHTYTSSAALNSAPNTGGFGFASFLIGYAVQSLFNLFSEAQVPALTAGQQIYRGVYFGDTWHVTGKLSVNLGLRYEQQGPWSERFDRLSYFDPNAINLASQTSGRSDRGEMFLVKTGRNHSRNSMPLDKTNLAPRIGLAYGLNPKTVIRSGYGIFWIPNYVAFSVNPTSDTVATATTMYTGSIDGGRTFINKISNPFPVTGIVSPPGRNFPAGKNIQSFTAGTILSATNYFDHPSGYVQQWNLDLQRELPADFFIDVAYAGAKGTHLPGVSTGMQADQLPDRYFAQAAEGTLDLFQPIPNPFTAMIGNGTALGGSTVNQGQLLLPYPQYNGVNFNGHGIYDSIYHSLQITAQRRFAGGATLFAAYTNAKLISDTDTLTLWLEESSGFAGPLQDNYNLRGERSLSAQDVPQRLVVSYVLDLPFGQGRKFLSGLTGPARKIVSGWGVDGITTLQRGFPLKFFTFNPTVLFWAGARPNRVPGCKADLSSSAESRLNEWFNTSCFSQPADFRFGNEPRVDSSLRQQGIVNFDLAVFKRTILGPADRLGFEFRAEFFNLFNHPQFGPPDTFLPSGTFGSIKKTVNNPRLVQFALKFVF